MRPVRFRHWLVQTSAEATRGCYAELAAGGAEGCACTPCQNFAALRDETYPVEVRRLMDELGVDFRQEAEVSHYARLPSGLHAYGGWFHLVGTLEDGRDALTPISQGGYTVDLERITERFSIGFTTKLALVPACFAGRPVLQVEFSAEIPWSIPLAEPE
jgi:hypothetical protein